MTDADDMTRILQDLAAGQINTDQAARRIDALSQPTGRADTPAEAVTPSEPVDQDVAAAAAETAQPDATSFENRDDTTAVDPDAWATSTDRPQQSTHTRESFPRAENRPAARTVPTGGVEKLSVRAVGRRVRIIAEPSVATVSADGPHVLRRNGSVLEISSDGEFGASIDGFQLLRATRNLDDFRSLGLGKELLLRVNPALLVDAEVTAGSLNTEGVTRLGSIRVTAGGARLLDVAEIADALVQAGQATVKGTIRTGRSRIRVESGSLTLQLSDESDVTVATETQLGKVSWGGTQAGFSGDEVVLGQGTARLDIEVVMGHASVRAGSAASAAGAA